MCIDKNVLTNHHQFVLTISREQLKKNEETVWFYVDRRIVSIDIHQLVFIYNIMRRSCQQ